LPAVVDQELITLLLVATEVLAVVVAAHQQVRQAALAELQQ
jgi:hypothetical protein